MTLRADSYSTAAEVTAFVRHLLDGQASFNSTTRPTLTELEKFIDRASGVLNNALLGAGFSPSAVIANSTAKLACDDWVTMRAADYTELTQRGTGYSEADGSRIAAFRSLYKQASEFIKELRPGLVEAGITQSGRLSDGLQFTGLDAVSDRLDPDDSSLEQPIFTRRQFDEPKASRFNSSNTNYQDND